MPSAPAASPFDQRDDDLADQGEESFDTRFDNDFEVALDYYRPPETETLGLIRLRANHESLTEIVFVNEAEATEPTRPNALTDRARAQLEEYFDGLRHTFNLPLSPRGTHFQRRVWKALTTIPFGETRCYAEIAEQLNRRGGQRAVGRANGQNPLAIVVPCHRVIGSDGRMTGYAGGIGRKQWLLAHEAGEIPFDLG